MPLRVDDRESIADEEDLWRRVVPLKACFQLTEAMEWRPSSAVFLDRTNREISVHRASLTSPDAVLANYPHNSLVAIKAGIPRGLGCVLCPDPIDDDASHALICPRAGLGISNLKSMAKRMALTARWVVLHEPPY